MDEIVAKSQLSRRYVCISLQIYQNRNKFKLIKFYYNLSDTTATCAFKIRNRKLQIIHLCQSLPHQIGRLQMKEREMMKLKRMAKEEEKEKIPNKNYLRQDSLKMGLGPNGFVAWCSHRSVEHDAHGRCNGWLLLAATHCPANEFGNVGLRSRVGPRNLALCCCKETITPIIISIRDTKFRSIFQRLRMIRLDRRRNAVHGKLEANFPNEVNMHFTNRKKSGKRQRRRKKNESAIAYFEIDEMSFRHNCVMNMICVQCAFENARTYFDLCFKLLINKYASSASTIRSDSICISV